MPVHKLDSVIPLIAPTAYIASTATIVGNVTLAEDVGVWYGAVLRGDNEPIRIGAKTNVQDLVVLHTDIGYPLTIGSSVTIGHQSTVHGCTIGDGSLIGIQAVILNGAVIGKQCLVGAGALITERKRFPDRSVIIGKPAKVVREVNDTELDEIAHGVAHYVDQIARYRAAVEVESDGPGDPAPTAGKSYPHILHPPTWPRPRGYSHGVLTRGQQIFISGQLGQDAEGHFPSMTLAGQTKQALENISALLTLAGARPQHLVRLTWYVTSMTDYLAELVEIGSGYRATIGKHFPAMSVVQVAGLVDARARVEIEATAVIPE